MNSKSEVAYRYYPLDEEMTINGQNFKEIVIDPHYETNHPYMNDEKILAIARQLDKKDNFIPHRQGTLPNGIEWKSFFQEPFFHEGQAHRLVWYWEENNPQLLIIHCFRRKKYEKNK